MSTTTTATYTGNYQPPPYPPPSYHTGSEKLDLQEKDFLTSHFNNTNGAPPTGSGPLLFPPHLVYDTAWVSSVSHLGPSKEQPQFAVVTPNRMLGCFNRGCIVLHSTTDKESAPIASVKREKGSKWRRSQITVAPRPGAANGQEQIITMHGCSSSKQEFSITVGDGLATERFEWRSSHGDEVKALSGGFNFGWKLCRLDGPTIAPGSVDTSNGGYSSDGKEIVAVGIQPRLFKKNPEFRFLGTGLTGQLGETFEIVAIMGFIRLCELASQEAAGASSSSSSSAAVAVA